MAEELGYFDDLCLNVEINASGANGQQLVSSGKAQFTELGSAEDVLMAAANSENITAIATFGTTSPFCIFANKDIESTLHREAPGKNFSPDGSGTSDHWNTHGTLHGRLRT